MKFLKNNKTRSWFYCAVDGLLSKPVIKFEHDKTEQKDKSKEVISLLLTDSSKKVLTPVC